MRFPIHYSKLLAFALALLGVCHPHPGFAQQDNDTAASKQTNAEATASPTNAAPAEMTEHNDRGAWHRHRIFHMRGDQPFIFSDAFIRKDETNSGNLVVVRGSTKIDGTVEGESVTVSGDAEINGRVSGDVSVVLGNLKLGPEADIGGQVVVVAGSLNRHPDAKIGDQVVVVDTATIPGLKGAADWVTKGLLLGRPLPFGVGWVWMVAGFFLLINLVLLLLFPRPIEACVVTVEQRPIGSFLTGILVKLLLVPAFLLLIVTGIGIIVVPFLIIALIVAFLFGKIAIYRYVGQQLGRQTHLHFLCVPAISLIVGTGLCYLLYAVPFLGFIMWGLVSIFGVGAVTMAMIQKSRGEKDKNGPRPIAPPAPVATTAAAAIAAPFMPPLASTATTPAAAASVSAPAPQIISTTYEAAMAGSAPPPIPVAPTERATAALSAAEASTWPRAGFWLRFLATLLDWILFVVVFVGGGHLLVPHRLIHFLELERLIVPLWLAYHVAMWTWKGTTIGGIVLGLKVVRVDGRPLDFSIALIRALAAILSFVVLWIGFFWAGWSREKQSWHDKIAGTVIVKAPHSLSLV
jgi:uncharacterized RDD family membrane protein YckC